MEGGMLLVTITLSRYPRGHGDVTCYVLLSACCLLATWEPSYNNKQESQTLLGKDAKINKQKEYGENLFTTNMN